MNLPQIDIRRKTCDIGNWKLKCLFLDISSTHIDTLVPSLYQSVESLDCVVLDTSAPTFERP
jgi:hypothetical protein